MLYGAVIAVALIFLLWTYLTADGDFLSALWKNLHLLFFPFSADKVEGSFFNDTLTSILTLELFMDAVYIVIAVIATALILWIAFALTAKRLSKKYE